MTADLEDGVARRRERLDEGRARGDRAGREHQDAVAVVAEAELGLAAEHSLAGDARDHPPLDRRVLGGQVGPERREDDEASHVRDVGGPAHQLLRARRRRVGPRPAVIDRDEAQAAARGMRAGGDDARHDARLGAETERMHRLDLEPRRREARRDGVRVIGQRRTELAEPADGRFHRGAMK